MADETRKVLVEIEYDTDASIDSLNKLTDEIVKNENELQALKDAYKKGTITQEQYSQAMEDTKTAIANGKKERKNLLTQLKSETGSVDKLKAQIADLTKRRNKLNQNTKEGKEQAQAYNAKLKDMKGALKEAQSGTKEAGNAFGRLRDDLQALPHPIGNIVTGIGGMTKAALKFIATPLGAIVAAIVFVVKQMVEAFKRSENRMVALKTIGASVSGVFKGIQKVLEPLVDFIFNKVIVAFETLSNVAEKGVRLVAKALNRLGFEKAGAAVDGYIDKIEEASKAAAELTRMEGELTKALREQERTQLDYQNRAEKLRQIRDDEALSIQERIDANIKLGKVLDEQLQKELAIANLALDVAEKNIEVNGETTEALDRRAEALTKIAEIEERITGQRSEQLVNINSLLKERKDLEDTMYDKLKEAVDQMDDLINMEDDYLDTVMENEESLDTIMTDIHQKRLAEIDEERLARIAADQEMYLSAVETMDRIGESAGLLKDERVALQSDILNAAYRFNNLEEQSSSQMFDNIANLATKLTNVINEGHEKQLTDLENTYNSEMEAENERYENSIANKELTDAELELLEEAHNNNLQTIEENYALEQLKLKKKQFDEDKKKALVDVAINTALAVTKFLATGNIPASIAAGVTGGIQAGIIAKSEFDPDSYAEGGKITLFGGKSHSMGGTHLFGTDGSHIEVEKDESAFVLKKDATAEIAALSAINESFGGRSFTKKSTFMQEGGQIPQGNFDLDGIVEAIKNITIVTKVSDVKTGLSKYDKVTNNSII